jgi:UDP-N-acetylmuramyl pentapeptide synthase
LKKLTDIIADINILELAGSAGIMVHALEFDSRKVLPGSLFFAVTGTVRQWKKELLLLSARLSLKCERIV